MATTPQSQYRMATNSAYVPHKRVQTHNDLPTRAKQSFAQESEINNILAKYHATGLVDHLASYGGTYADMPSNLDFQDATNTVMEAKKMFDALPSNIRTLFDNDPAEFLAFVENPENIDEMVELGLATQPAPKIPPAGPKTPPAEPVSEPVAPASEPSA